MRLEAGSPFVTQVAAEQLSANLPTLKQISVRHVDPLENRPLPQGEQGVPHPAPLPADENSASLPGSKLKSEG